MRDRSKLQGLLREVMDTSKPIYINQQGSTSFAYNTLTEERELELTKHLSQCDVALQQCPECWLLYVSIGQEEYVKRLTEDME